MDSHQLACKGGPRTIEKNFDRYNSIGAEEIAAAVRVLESGVLSQFIGGWSPDFFGGSCVQAFERACEKYFNVKHAVSVNSWTSGLICAVGAIDIEPGDEVIVTPWTMCASATAILHWNAIPVFADIEPETFNLDPLSVEANITPFTKAIMAVDIFGHSCDVSALTKIANKHGLKLITDTAQAPGAWNNGRMTGTLADVGGFSLNYHKHIHTGEGGVLVTNDDRIFERAQLIRNHGEAVVEGKGVTDIQNIIGHNFRMGEIEAAIGLQQLKKVDTFVAVRQALADRLTAGLAGLRGLRLPVLREGVTHSYYVYPLVIETDLLGVSRAKIVSALRAEGVPGVMEGYVNVHMLPMYQRKIAYGTSGFPWTSDICRRDVDYSKGICPVAEKLHDETFMGIEMCAFDLCESDIDLIAGAFHKVWAGVDQLA